MFLQQLLIIIGFAVVVVIVFHKLKLPLIAGFILTGVLVGPQGIGLIGQIHQVEILSEIGVALLLFGIGAELSLKKLQRLWKLAILGGMIQVGLTVLTVYLLRNILELSGASAVIIGFIVAFSSTAIVLQGLQQRGEVDAPHGRLILGILVFQDFSVVPLMLFMPLLSGAELSTGLFAATLLKSAAIVIVTLLLAIMVVPRILKLVAKTRQRQLFILAVVVICLGTAWLVTQSGVSLAIGAFLAGLVVSGSEFRHQALADMISFREVFASIFFVSIGMLLSPVIILDDLPAIIILLAGIILGKAVIVFITSAILRMPFRVCLIAAFALAQVGEFSFVVLYALKGTRLMTMPIENNLISAAILSMFITPFAMAYGPKLAGDLRKFRRFKNWPGVETATAIPETACNLCDHVIIAGYGFAGRELSRALDEHKIAYIVVDLNIDNVRIAAQESRRAVFGDITSEEVLIQLGIKTARELVLLVNDPYASELAVRIARHLAPKLTITVRTTYLLDIDPLLAAGASEVVRAEREAAVCVASQMLRRYQVGAEQIAAQVAAIRNHSERENG